MIKKFLKYFTPFVTVVITIRLAAVEGLLNVFVAFHNANFSFNIIYLMIPILGFSLTMFLFADEMKKSLKWFLIFLSTSTLGSMFSLSSKIDRMKSEGLDSIPHKFYILKRNYTDDERRQYIWDKLSLNNLNSENFPKIHQFVEETIRTNKLLLQIEQRINELLLSLELEKVQIIAKTPFQSFVDVIPGGIYTLIGLAAVAGGILSMLANKSFQTSGGLSKDTPSGSILYEQAQGVASVTSNQTVMLALAELSDDVSGLKTEVLELKNNNETLKSDVSEAVQADVKKQLLVEKELIQTKINSVEKSVLNASNANLDVKVKEVESKLEKLKYMGHKTYHYVMDMMGSSTKARDPDYKIEGSNPVKLPQAGQTKTYFSYVNTVLNRITEIFPGIFGPDDIPNSKFIREKGSQRPFRMIQAEMSVPFNKELVAEALALSEEKNNNNNNNNNSNNNSNNNNNNNNKELHKPNNLDSAVSEKKVEAPAIKSKKK